MELKSWYFGLFLLVVSCSKNDDPANDHTLAAALKGKEVVMGNVIACAATNEDSATVSVFFYPRENATNIRFYQTENAKVDKDDFNAYTKEENAIRDVFNGYLQKFEVAPKTEKWVVVSFEEAGKTHLSNPIRLKQQTKPTQYLPDNTTYNTMGNMPLFSWQDGVYTDSVIYFQVVSDVTGDLLSGTYTTAKQFQYYNVDNVVLNITRTTPPILVPDSDYKFTLMAVSEDNWVNLISQLNFKL